jgi:beta-galactosidase/beta-glucuronidase
VQRLLEVDEALWYHRTFCRIAKRRSSHFDQLRSGGLSLQVFVNGQKVGEHQGGNNPFSGDATERAVKSWENELIVRVEDETEAFQLRGKQVLNPGGIFYTQVSGIWQTVWMEEVPSTVIDDLEYVDRCFKRHHHGS